MTLEHVQRVRTLYKLILRLNRGLPPELQVIGTNYVKDEFKRHKTCSEQEANVFLVEWTNYAITLAQQFGLKGPPKGLKSIGSGLSSDVLNELRDEQVVQLYELMKAAKGEEEEGNEKSEKT